MRPQWMILLTLPLACTACRPECKQDEVRWGDKCAKVPDAGGENSHDASSDETDASDIVEPTVDDAGDVPIADDAGDEAIVEDAGGGMADADTDSGANEVDPCEPNPCGSGFICVSAPSGSARCAAACASSELGCRPGDPCAEDADCQTGGHATATCEPAAKACVMVCGTTTIVSPANVEAARYCREIDGDLLVDPNSESIDSAAFPYLTRVRGNLTAGSSAPLSPLASMSSPLTSLTLEKLERVDGDVQFGSLISLKVLDLPRLRSVGGWAVVIATPSLEHVSLPNLSEVAGSFSVIGAPRLTQLDLGRLETVGGTLSFRVLCMLPWSQLAPLERLGENQSIFAIGCCTTLGDHSCSGMNCACN